MEQEGDNKSNRGLFIKAIDGMSFARHRKGESWKQVKNLSLELVECLKPVYWFIDNFLPMLNKFLT